MGRMETVGSRRIERPQCATDIRNSRRQPVHFGISLQSQVAAFISSFAPSSTGGNAGGNEAFINSIILVECALRTSYRVQVGSQIIKQASTQFGAFFLQFSLWQISVQNSNFVQDNQGHAKTFQLVYHRPRFGSWN